MAAVAVPVRSLQGELETEKWCLLGRGDVNPVLVAPVCLTALVLSALASGLLLFFTLVIYKVTSLKCK